MKPRRSPEESRDLRARIIASLDSLKGHISQRELEKLLRISPAYLSRLRGSAGAPSGALVSLLALVAENPAQVLPQLRRYWASPPPNKTSEDALQPAPPVAGAAK